MDPGATATVTQLPPEPLSQALLHQLPAPPRYFIGRDEELKTLRVPAQNGIAISGLRAPAIAHAEPVLPIFEAIESPSAERVRKKLAEWRGEDH